MPIKWSHRVAVFLLLSCVTDVIYGLRFTAEPVDRIVVLDQTLLWNCVAEDDAYSITYRWRFNGASVPLHENQVIYDNGTLLLRKVSSDNVGTYSCLATSGETTLQSRAAKLELAYINPSFSIQPLSQSVMLGENVVLTCYIESLPLADVTWTLNGDKISSGTVTQDSNGTSTLALYPVMYYNVGTYKCVGTNPLTGVYRYSNDASLVVKGQPVFLSSLKSVILPLGYQATFQCYFHGNPEPNVTWLVHFTGDDGSVTSNEVQTSDKYMVYDNGTFIIHNVTKEDEAFYTCNVENSYGEMSQSASLTVTGPATPPDFTFRPTNNTVQQGDTVMFYCDCSGNPEPKVTWEKASIVVSNNGSLSLSDVQAVDTGWYTCLCENDVGTVTQSVYLDVYTLPVITRSPEDVRVRKGTPIVLHCSAAGNPSPSISWVTPRFGSVVTTINEATLYENGSLFISSASLTDTGEYTCLVRNIVGMAMTAGSVTVEVAPVMTLLPVSQGVTVGSRVFLHCQASGVPDPIYSWSKSDEGAITSTSQRQIYMNNTLVIHSVSKPDEGLYRCVAGNDLGVTQAVATITVTVPPSFTTVPNNQTVQLGSLVQLSCVADGDPVPTQKWTKDDRQLVLDDNMELPLDQTLLTIHHIRVTQFGKYTCVISNIAGTESASAWLKIYDIPDFSVFPENTTVTQSATLTLQCQGQAIEVPSVRWYKGREGKMTQLISDSRVTVSNSGVLQIELVDQDSDEGWYTCVLRNSAGEVSKNVFVEVQVPPRILSTNSPQSAVVQSEITLTCKSTGDPTPTLQWIDPSGHVIRLSSTYQMTDSSLKIVSVREIDFGDWTCKYCSQLGCDTALVQLNPEGMPSIESFTGAQDGSLITVECIVEGNPEPYVSFTTKGQSVTSALQGHTVKNNKILIEVEFLKTEYKCLAENVHGTSFKTLSVPSKMETPAVSVTEPGTVTLSWNVPPGLGDLPLTGYILQSKSNLDVSWEPVQVLGHDLLNERSLKVTDLEPNREYIFRMAARNLLGLGEYSDQTTSIRTQSAAPSPPKDVLAIQVDDGLVILMWERSENLNAPIAEVVYEYKVVKPVKKGNVETEIHTQGTVLYNQTFQAEIKGLTEPVIYILSVLAKNIKLNQSSDPVIIELDMTGSGYLEPEPHADNSSLDRDKVIAIVAGSFGGIIVVILIVFLVTRARNHRKSKTLSFLDHRLSLDQFYMENPKTLYNEDKQSSKRKSGISFYSFDESFQSTMGSKGRHNGSMECLDSSLSSDVLLVSRSPLNMDTEVQYPVSQASSKDKLYNETIQETACVQSEIDIPSCDITLAKGASKEDQYLKEKGADKGSNKRPVAISKEDNKGGKDLENDTELIYSSMNPSTSRQENPDQSSDHIYTSIHSSDTQLSNKYSSSAKSSNSGQHKPLLRVLSPDRRTKSTHSVSNLKKKYDSMKFCDELEKSRKERCTRSASPPVRDSNSNEPKPPVRVLSLELLSPSVKTNFEKDRDIKLLSESMVKKMNARNKRYREKCRDMDKNKRNSESAIDKYIKNDFHYPGETPSRDVCTRQSASSDRDSENIESTPLKVDSLSQKARINGHHYGVDLLKGLKGDNSVTNGNEVLGSHEENLKIELKPKNVTDDNFLTEAEIKKELTSAVLY